MKTPPAWQLALFARRSLGVIRGLEAVRAAHVALGEPGAGVPVVHVVGTNGSLSSDFPLLIQSGRRWGPRKLEGTIGSGGGSLKLETVNGGIQLVHL